MSEGAAADEALRDFDRYRAKLLTAALRDRRPPLTSPGVTVLAGVFVSAATFAFITPAAVSADFVALACVIVPVMFVWGCYGRALLSRWRRRQLVNLGEICVRHARRLRLSPAASDPHVAARLLWLTNASLDSGTGYPPPPHAHAAADRPNLAAFTRVAACGHPDTLPLLGVTTALLLTGTGPPRRHFVGDNTALARLVSLPFEPMADRVAETALMMRAGGPCKAALSRTVSSDHDNATVAGHLRRLYDAGPEAMRVAAALDDTSWTVDKLVATAVMLAADGDADLLAS